MKILQLFSVFLGPKKTFTCNKTNLIYVQKFYREIIVQNTISFNKGSIIFFVHEQSLFNEHDITAVKDL